jgi:hypothetical protein
VQTQQAIEPTVIDPEAIAAFYRRRPGVEEAVRQVVRIVQEEFPPVESITLQAERDPEEDAEWIRVTVIARLSPDDLQAAYLRFIDRRIAELSAEMRHFVRLWRMGA